MQEVSLPSSRYLEIYSIYISLCATSTLQTKTNQTTPIASHRLVHTYTHPPQEKKTNDVWQNKLKSELRMIADELFTFRF